MNIKKTTKRILALLVIFSTFYTGYLNTSVKSAEQSSSINVTTKLETLGQPFTYDTDLDAQNVWDMQSYNGKIYLGYGDYDKNTGPTPIICYDPSSSKFITEYSAQDEEINTYKVLNGQLYVSGLDPIKWLTGDFYRMENGIWKQYKNLPQTIHTFDMAYYNNRLYAATALINYYNGEEMSLGQILESSDNGNTWRNMTEGQLNFYDNNITKSDLNYYDTGRMLTLFQFQGKLYGSRILSSNNNSKHSYTNHMVCIDSNDKITDLQVGNLLPSVDNSKIFYIIFKPTVVNDKLIYIVTPENMWGSPEGLFITSDLQGSSTRVTLPEKDALPIDILARGNSTYVLAYIKTASNDYINIVYKSDDLTNWTEQFRFQQDTFARSFEEMNGDFYFGLGSESNNKKESTGKILRVKATSLLSQP